MGNSVASIGSYAFQSCSRLTSITIPNSVTSIGYNAFRECSSLTSVTITNSVTDIDEYAFYNCKSLSCVAIPDSIGYIAATAFEGCSSLESVNGCKSCGDDGKCSECKDGYSNSDGKCISSSSVSACEVEHCSKCDSDNHCEICEEGYNVSNGECISNSSISACEVEHCSKCDSDNHCEICEEGYNPSDGECFRLVFDGQYVDNCPEHSEPVNGLCSCLSEYFINRKRTECVQECGDSEDVYDSRRCVESYSSEVAEPLTGSDVIAIVGSTGKVTLGNFSSGEEMSVFELGIEGDGEVTGGDKVTVNLNSVNMKGGTLRAGEGGTLKFESNLTISGESKIIAGSGSVEFSSNSILSLVSSDSNLPQIDLGSGTGGESPNIELSGLNVSHVGCVIVRGSVFRCSEWRNHVSFSNSSTSLSTKCQISTSNFRILSSESTTELVIVEDESGADSLSLTIIIVIIASCVVVVALIIILIVCFVKKRTNYEGKDEVEDL